MNILLWLVAGSVLAWIAYAQLGLNKGRSMTISILVGAAGALLGGIVIAPRFAEFAPAPGIVSITDLFFAMAAAVVCLALDSLLYRRWGA
jgi:uncharacterized membrane protein YeaQ/YmgE (transglycosylase-associated protein family)